MITESMRMDRNGFVKYFLELLVNNVLLGNESAVKLCVLFDFIESKMNIMDDSIMKHISSMIKDAYKDGLIGEDEWVWDQLMQTFFKNRLLPLSHINSDSCAAGKCKRVVVVINDDKFDKTYEKYCSMHQFSLEKYGSINMNTNRIRKEWEKHFKAERRKKRLGEEKIKIKNAAKKAAEKAVLMEGYWKKQDELRKKKADKAEANRLERKKHRDETRAINHISRSISKVLGGDYVNKVKTDKCIKSICFNERFKDVTTGGECTGRDIVYKYFNHCTLKHEYTVTTCKTEMCVNPGHLMIVGREEYFLIKKHERPIHKSMSGKPTKVTLAEVRLIRADGSAISEIAKKYNVSQALISTIKRRAAWAWVLDDLKYSTK